MSKNSTELVYERPGYLARQFHRIATTLFLEETQKYDVTSGFVNNKSGSRDSHKPLASLLDGVGKSLYKVSSDNLVV